MRRETFLARAGATLAGIVLGRGIELPSEEAVVAESTFAPVGGGKILARDVRIEIDGVDLSSHVRSIGFVEERWSLEGWSDATTSDRIEVYP